MFKDRQLTEDENARVNEIFRVFIRDNPHLFDTIGIQGIDLVPPEWVVVERD